MAVRVINDAGIQLLDLHEGCRLTSYQDAGGIWTIGWGHTGPEVVAGMTITQDQADALRLHDLQSVYQTIARLVTVPLTDNEFAALCSLVYNIGADQFGSSTLLRMLNSGDYNGAAGQFLVWNEATVDGKKVVLPGLVARRKDELTLWLTPDMAQQVAAVVAPPVIESVTPTKPKLTPLVYTKTMIGLAFTAIGKGLDYVSDYDFSNAAGQVTAFSDLGPWIRKVAFVLTAIGIGLAVYGRIINRRNKGV